ncbi:MAG: sulfotransferase family protein, partial [Geminicoccaceae bacterium]
VGGSPRSGTTLLAAMLGAHDQVVCLPESPFIGNLALALRCGRVDRGAAEEVHRVIRGNFKFAFWKLTPADLNACAKVTGPSYRDLIEAYVRCFAQRNSRPDAAFWADHSPSTIMYSARLSSAFTDGKFIHIVRDGRAVCASWIPLDWGPNTIVWAARAWAMHVGYGLAAEAALPPANVRRVTYEALAASPEKVLRPLCDWLGLPYQSTMLTSSGLQVPAYTRNQHALIGAPADPKRIDRWRTRLTTREVELFEYVTGDLLVNLGYDLAVSGGCFEPSKLEMLRIELTERTRQFMHFATSALRRRRFRTSLSGELSAQESARK